jgi:hypothetical protein
MDIVIKNASMASGLAPLEPFIVNWSRLEPLPVTPDLQTGLQARIGDPLWLLGRQWQFNEFQADDAGSPIDVRVRVDCGHIDRFRLGPATPPSAGARDFEPLEVPLEVAVESEAAPRQALRIVAEAGLQLQRRLRAASITSAADVLLTAFPLELIPADAATDRVGAAWLALLRGRAIDGNAIAAVVRPLVRADGTLSALPVIAGYVPTTAEIPKVQTVLAQWYSEYESSFETAAPGPGAWVPARQEYAFAARVRLPGGGTALLNAAEYTDGKLDWYSFDLADDPGSGEPAVPVTPTVLAPLPMLPSPVRYPGMPADRYWEFEDAKVSFGGVGAGPTELMRLLLIEFALVYGNDWFYVPIDLPVGSLCSISRLEVRDTFGVVTSIDPARNTTGRAWRLFELTNGSRLSDRAWFFLAPTLPARLQGDPVEQLALFRDEMANMAWAVERRVQSPVTGTLDRSLEPYESRLHQEVQGGTIDAELVYRLQTDVPDRWIPLVPAADPLPGTGVAAFTHWLERRALIRTLPDGSRRTIHPRGKLLRTDETMAPAAEPALRLAEEEVPRDGAVVRRAYQYTRWLDGTSHLWLGRDKTTGRGEGGSNLRFDLLVRRVMDARP